MLILVRDMPSKEKISALKKGRQQLQRAWNPAEHRVRQGHKLLPSANPKGNIIEAYTGNDVSHKEVRTS
jgi:hypothetical protein